MFISYNLSIAKAKKVCYNKGAKGQGGTVQWQSKFWELLKKSQRETGQTKYETRSKQKDTAQSTFQFQFEVFWRDTYLASGPGSIHGSLMI